MEKEKTALTILIEYINQKISETESNTLTSALLQQIRNRAIIFKSGEKEDIISAYNDGSLNGREQTAEEYFEEKFEQ